MDDLTVDLPTGRPEVLRAAVEEVPGVGAEGIRPTESVRAPLLAPLELPAALAQTEPSSVLKRLIEGLPKALFANWSWAFHGYDGRPTVIAASVGAPSLSNIETPWLPLEDARRLAPAQWMPPAWRMGPGSEAAAASLHGSFSAVLVVRRNGPRFTTTELLQLTLLAQIVSTAKSTSTVPIAPSHSTTSR